MHRFWRPILGLVAAAGLLLSLLSLNPLSRWASAEAQATVTSTVAIYAGLRAFNAILSTAQEVEVGGSFVVQGSARPLKILEPVDDTVEKVAGIVLSVSIFAGVLMLAFSPFSAVGWALVGIAVLAWERTPDLARRLLSSGLLLAAVLPVMFLAAGVIGDVMTKNVWDRNQAILDRIAERTGAEAALDEAVPVSEPDAEEGVWSWLPGRGEGADASGTMTRITRYSTAAFVLFEEAEPLLRSYIEILAVWLLKLVALPAAFMLITLRLLRIP